MIHINVANKDSVVVCADVANLLFSGWNEKFIVSSYKMKRISYVLDCLFHLNLKSASWTQLTGGTKMNSYVHNKRRCHRTQPVCGGLTDNGRRGF